jgi:hypothetical protein
VGEPWAVGADRQRRGPAGGATGAGGRGARPGEENARRDRELKRKLYAVYGVDEYWIVDPLPQAVEV